MQHHRAGAGGVRPRMGVNLSSQWLQRCKPDLTSEPNSEEDKDGVSVDRNPVAAELREYEGEDDEGSGKEVGLEDGERNGMDELSSPESTGEEAMGEEEFIDDCEEEEKGKQEEKELEGEGEGESGSSTEEDAEGGCGGWDGRLGDSEEESSKCCFDPASRHGDCGPIHSNLIGSSRELFTQPPSSTPTTTAVQTVGPKRAKDDTLPLTSVKSVTNSQPDSTKVYSLFWPSQQ